MRNAKFRRTTRWSVVSNDNLGAFPSTVEGIWQSTSVDCRSSAFADWFSICWLVRAKCSKQWAWRCCLPSQSVCLAHANFPALATGFAFSRAWRRLLQTSVGRSRQTRCSFFGLKCTTVAGKPLKFIFRTYSKVLQITFTYFSYLSFEDHCLLKLCLGSINENCAAPVKIFLRQSLADILILKACNLAILSWFGKFINEGLPSIPLR